MPQIFRSVSNALNVPQDSRGIILWSIRVHCVFAIERERRLDRQLGEFHRLPKELRLDDCHLQRYMMLAVSPFDSSLAQNADRTSPPAHDTSMPSKLSRGKTLYAQAHPNVSFKSKFP